MFLETFSKLSKEEHENVKDLCLRYSCVGNLANRSLLFEKHYRNGFPISLLYSESSILAACFGVPIPNGSGFFLSEVIVDPTMLGNSIYSDIITHIIKEFPSGILLMTTRVPDFYSNNGFQHISHVGDGNYIAIHLRQ